MTKPKKIVAISTEETKLSTSAEKLRESLLTGLKIGAGVLKMGKNESISTILKGVQGFVKDRNFEQFSYELNQLQEAGKIKNDFVADVKSRGFKSLIEVLRMIDDEGITEDEKFELVKRLFFGVVKKEITTGEELIRYQVFRMSLRLDANDMLVIGACYQLLHQQHERPNSHDSWRKLVSQELGYNDATGIVGLSEERLVDSQLLADRTHSDRSGIGRPNYMRLTDFGVKFGEVLEEDLL